MKYEKDFFDSACEYDEVTDQNGNIVKYASLIIEKQGDLTVKEVKDALKLIIKNTSFILALDVKDKVIKEKWSNVASILNEKLFSYIGYSKVTELFGELNKNNKQGIKSLSLENETEDTVTCNTDEKSLEELLKEMDSLVGLTEVKEKVNDLISYHKIQKLRSSCNMKVPSSTMHMAFTGNPGTGKTTVARIVGRIYKKIGLLSKGHFIEVSRTDLIAGYQGQTALKVKNVIERAKGGVLFIDEAYSITENESTDSYGRECLTELTKALEDYRDDLVVIVAGYTKPMEQFFDSNPGLRSRFNTFIEFKDYSADELIKILEKMCAESDYELDDKLKENLMTKLSVLLCGSNKKGSEDTSKESNESDTLEDSKETDDVKKDFSNGRFIRNIYDDLIMNHAKRVISVIDEDNIDKSLLSKLTIEDLKKYDW